MRGSIEGGAEWGLVFCAGMFLCDSDELDSGWIGLSRATDVLGFCNSGGPGGLFVFGRS